MSCIRVSFHPEYRNGIAAGAVLHPAYQCRLRGTGKRLIFHQSNNQKTVGEIRGNTIFRGEVIHLNIVNQQKYVFSRHISTLPHLYRGQSCILLQW